jgi:hypothetical protein
MHGTNVDPNAPIYFSAIWVKRSGPAFKILPLGTKEEAEQFIKDNQNPPEGDPYWPRMIAACGSFAPRFSVVVEQGAAESYVVFSKLGKYLPKDFEAANSKLGEYPLCVALYGHSFKIDGVGGDNDFFSCAIVWQKQRTDRWIYFNGFSVAEGDVATIDAAMQSGFARAEQVLVYRQQTGVNPPVLTRATS